MSSPRVAQVVRMTQKRTKTRSYPEAWAHVAPVVRMTPKIAIQLQGALERHACQYQHQDHEYQQESYVAAYCGEVGAFEQDLFDRAY